MDVIASTGGVLFLDPGSSPPFDPQQPHPSFLFEIPFNLAVPPTASGQFSIDYDTGEVVVFGTNGILGNFLFDLWGIRIAFTFWAVRFKFW